VKGLEHLLVATNWSYPGGTEEGTPNSGIGALWGVDELMKAGGQGITLVHFPAQPAPFFSPTR
jgi:hypothetical protein